MSGNTEGSPATECESEKERPADDVRECEGAPSRDAGGSSATAETASSHLAHFVDALVAFQQKHGHANVPRRYHADVSLGIFVHALRNGRVSLSAADAARLRKGGVGVLGAASSPTTFVSFSERLAEARRGTPNVEWLATQRSLHKYEMLSLPRIRQLADAKIEGFVKGKRRAGPLASASPAKKAALTSTDTSSNTPTPVPVAPVAPATTQEEAATTSTTGPSAVNNTTDPADPATPNPVTADFADLDTAAANTTNPDTASIAVVASTAATTANETVATTNNATVAGVTEIETTQVNATTMALNATKTSVNGDTEACDIKSFFPPPSAPVSSAPPAAAARTTTSETLGRPRKTSATHNHWEDQFAALISFRDKYGHTRVPTKAGQVHSSLGRWVARQRTIHSSGKMQATRLAALQSINFEWTRRLTGTKTPTTTAAAAAATVAASATPAFTPSSTIASPSTPSTFSLATTTTTTTAASESAATSALSVRRTRKAPRRIDSAYVYNDDPDFVLDYSGAPLLLPPAPPRSASSTSSPLMTTSSAVFSTTAPPTPTATAATASTSPALALNPSPAADLSWADRLAELRVYVEVFGHCNVPPEVDASLSEWNISQLRRNAYRQLSSAQFNDLMVVTRCLWLSPGPAVFTHELLEAYVLKREELAAGHVNPLLSWSRGIHDLGLFHKLVGNCAVPLSRLRLARWVAHVRVQSDGHHLNDDCRQQLAQLDFPFVHPLVRKQSNKPSASPTTASATRALCSFEEGIALLSNFRARYDHANVPLDCDTHLGLSDWAAHIRYEFALGRLPALQIGQLTQFGFHFTSEEDTSPRQAASSSSSSNTTHGQSGTKRRPRQSSKSNASAVAAATTYGAAAAAAAAATTTTTTTTSTTSTTTTAVGTVSTDAPVPTSAALISSQPSTSTIPTTTATGETSLPKTNISPDQLNELQRQQQIIRQAQAAVLDHQSHGDSRTAEGRTSTAAREAAHAAAEKARLEREHEEAVWTESYACLADFERFFGHPNVPIEWPMLGRWVAKQRHDYRTLVLPRERTDALNRIGFQWTIPKPIDDDFESIKLEVGEGRAEGTDAEHRHTLHMLLWQWGTLASLTAPQSDTLTHSLRLQSVIERLRLSPVCQSAFDSLSAIATQSINSARFQESFEHRRNLDSHSLTTRLKERIDKGETLEAIERDSDQTLFVWLTIVRRNNSLGLLSDSLRQKLGELGVQFEETKESKEEDPTALEEYSINLHSFWMGAVTDERLHELSLEMQ